MNTAVLFLAASVALPLAVMEVRRKWRDAQRHIVLHGASPWDDAASVLNGQPVRTMRANPAVEANEPGKAGNGGIRFLSTPDGVDGSWIAERIAAHPFTPAPVWMGVDLGSSKDLCVGHGDGSYTSADHSASGTSVDISSDFGSGK